MSFSCRICGSTTRSASYNAREMMFGTKEEFVYDECGDCRSIQIGELPGFEEMARHYPANYYSFGTQERRSQTLKERINKQREKAEIGMFSKLGVMLSGVKPLNRPLNAMLSQVHMKRSSKVLDVGCGSAGKFIDWLRSLGLKDVSGCDPFVDQDSTTPGGAKIHKKQLSEMKGAFDLITFHHSLEHVPDPLAALRSARMLTADGGHCLVRIPTPSCDLWDIYGTDWVEFDAPRHFHLMSRDGFKRIAEQAGFKLVAMIDDMDGWAIHASEEYRKGVPLIAQKPLAADLEQEVQSRARTMNLMNRGCRTGIVLAAVN